MGCATFEDLRSSYDWPTRLKGVSGFTRASLPMTGPVAAAELELSVDLMMPACIISCLSRESLSGDVGQLRPLLHRHVKTSEIVQCLPPRGKL